MINNSFTFIKKYPPGVIISGILAVFILSTMAIDWLNAFVNQYSFYFSESFLFSSFWWIFIPLIIFQQYFSKLYKSKFATFLLIIIPLFVHLFVYPAVVWLLSTVFYNHSFAYLQTLLYELESYSFILLIVYTLPFILLKNINQVQTTQNISNTLSFELPANKIISSIPVSDGRKKQVIQTADILYIMASSPYIHIHTGQKKYIHNQSLKSISLQLDGAIFIRIHKSYIVNIKAVSFYTSRQNGDYDITLINGTRLRLSRNYAALFRQNMEIAHQVTA